MSSRTITQPDQLPPLYALLGNLKLPVTVSWVQGKARSIEQNRLQRRWMQEAAEQLGDETAEQKRGYCKLHFGIPILRAENDEFAAEYDEVIRPLPYEQKLRLMMVPFDFGVTRIMRTKQKRAYLDAVADHFRGLGVVLTEPEGNS